MAQKVKYLLSGHEDLSSTPSTHVMCWPWWHMMDGRERQVSYPSRMVVPDCHEGSCLKRKEKPKMGGA